MGIIACRVSALLILQAIMPFHENRVWPREITNQLWNDEGQWFVMPSYSQYRSGEVVSCLQAEKLRVLHWLASQLASCYPVYRICYRFKNFPVLKHYIYSKLYTKQLLLLLGRNKVLDQKFLANLFQFAKFAKILILPPKFCIISSFRALPCNQKQWYTFKMIMHFNCAKT